VTEASVRFVGNATTLLQLGNFTLLTDPNFVRAGQRVYLGNGMWTKRRLDPALAVEELPVLDAVVLSHLHGDHFDRVAKKGLPADTPIITTRQAARRLRRRFPAVGLHTWGSEELRSGDQVLRITALPGQHAPRAMQPLLPPVMGSLLDLEQGGRRLLRLYITGDTLLKPVLQTIPERFPDIDVMLIHLGGTRLLGVTLTMDARQGYDLVRMVGAPDVVPIHFDDYPVFKSPLDDFVNLFERGGEFRVRPIARGQTMALPQHAAQ
jgi:L-ascorbate metabolism protein UlaG (beta-lactamase superfamily)